MLPALHLERYGKIDRFWFDQYGFGSARGQSPAGLFPGAWQNVVDHVHAVSPGTMMLPGPDGCLNPGEGGGGQYPIINYVNSTITCSYREAAPVAKAVYGQHYVPYESDLSIQNPGDAWFWHKGHVFDSGPQLFGKYLATAGRGSHFILNVPPNTTGLVPEEFVASVTAMGDAVRSSFGTNAGAMSFPATGTCGTLSATVKVTGAFDAVMLTEGLEYGQGILAYTLEAQDGATGTWATLTLDPASAGQTIAGKNIAILEASAVGGAVVQHFLFWFVLVICLLCHLWSAAYACNLAHHMFIIEGQYLQGNTDMCVPPHKLGNCLRAVTYI